MIATNTVEIVMIKRFGSAFCQFVFERSTAPANVATMAASLGVPTALCSYIGADFPEDFRSLLEGKGVDLRDLVVVEDQETATVWIISDEHHNQIAYVYQGPMAKMESMPLRLDAARESERVHIMTGRPPYYLDIMKECRRLGKGIGFDPAQEIHNVWNAGSFNEAIAMSEMFFANENELRTALRKGASSSSPTRERPPPMITIAGLSTLSMLAMATAR